jgi:short-subunit dehydrogenase
MPKRFSGLVTVITGASSGIGRATALEMARQGGTVVLASRQGDALRTVATECEHLGGRALVVQTDVTNAEQVHALAKRAIESFGRIDAWINNAGVALYARFEDAPDDVFRRVIETNLFGCINGARAVLPYFREQREGVLINLSSAFGRVGAPYVSAYATSKFAISGFSESLRMELRNDPHIHVCTVFPATMDTPIFQHAANYTGRFIQALPPVYKAEQVTDAILDCILDPKAEVMVGGSVKQAHLLRKVSSSLSERLIAKKVEKKHFLDKPGAVSKGNVFEPMPEYNTVSGGWLETDHKGKKIIAAAATLLLAGAGFAFYKYKTRNRSSMKASMAELRATLDEVRV